MTTQHYCKDCKWYVKAPLGTYFWPHPAGDMCRHPSLVYDDPVKGRVKLMQTCSSRRTGITATDYSYREGTCGLKAVQWEPKVHFMRRLEDWLEEHRIVLGWIVLFSLALLVGSLSLPYWPC